jgi:alpha-glutamyl/putrescinyl thymine pyrophosphorylase clade 1
MNLSNLSPTVVFDTYWQFAAERQAIYLRRLAGQPPPWTNDPILETYKFTNAFRAADRVSQYCIKEVIYGGSSMEPDEVIFRVLLFKLFNSIPAWETLVKAFGTPKWKTFDAHAYKAELGRAKAAGVKIWNAAYMQKPQYRTDLRTKHERYLALVSDMMQGGITDKLLSAPSYEQACDALRVSPVIGDFTAMQLLTDLNYSEVINFDEDEYIVPGPGALDGINKCFGLSLNKNHAQYAASIIRLCVDVQEDAFKKRGLTPVTLFGRRLHLIDCQNLFCETDKYARVAHPQFNRGRSEIKQKLKPAGPLPKPFFPPKW